MMLILVKPMVNVGEAQAVNRIMAVNGRGQEVLDLGLELTGANLQEAPGFPWTLRLDSTWEPPGGLLGASPSARTCINPPSMI